MRLDGPSFSIRGGSHKDPCAVFSINAVIIEQSEWGFSVMPTSQRCSKAAIGIDVRLNLGDQLGSRSRGHSIQICTHKCGLRDSYHCQSYRNWGKVTKNSFN